MKFILIIFLISSSQVYSCDCKTRSIENAREIDYQKFELVFLGKIVKISKNVAKVKVLESYKGLTHSVLTIDMVTDCPSNIRLNEKWLIYTNCRRGKIAIDECSMSRSLSNPIKTFIYYTEKLNFPLSIRDFDSKNNLTELELLKIKASMDLEEEIGLLRYKSLKGSLNILESKLNKEALNLKYLSLIFVSLFLISFIYAISVRRNE